MLDGAVCSPPPGSGRPVGVYAFAGLFAPPESSLRRPVLVRRYDQDACDWVIKLGMSSVRDTRAQEAILRLLGIRVWREKRRCIDDLIP
jgi:hypothetical protein